MEAALSELNMEEVNIMMASLVQVQVLVMVQVSQAVQERVREIAEAPEAPAPADLERRIKGELDHEKEEGLRQQLAEYEQALEEEQKADLERLEDYEAVVAAEAAQRWDDWALTSEMQPNNEDNEGTVVKRPRLRVALQHHEPDGGVS